ncbi:MAG: cytochrome c biogenesis protein ResB [Kineosporiaceae bacterium]
MVDTLLPETARPEPIRQPGLGPVGWLRWAWRQLTSMRVALLLLMLLAVAAVPGSVFPQRRIDPGAVTAYVSEHPSTGPWLDRLGAFDVYSSPWFAAVYLLLFVSLVGCVVPRARQHWRSARSAPPRTPRRLDRLPVHATAVLDGVDEAAALDAARTALRRRRFRLADHGSSVAAEQGHSAETGNVTFHLALLGLLVSIAAGSLFSYSGQAIVVEGERFANVWPRYNSFQAGRQVDTGDLPPFTMTLDSLSVVFDETTQGNQFGAPRSFDGRLTVVDEPGAAPRAVDLRVNSPLDVDGTRVFLVGNGYAPVVTVRDGEGQVAASGPVPFLTRDARYTSVGVVKAPDAAPRQIGLSGLFLPTAFVDPRLGPVSIFPDAKDPRLYLTAWVSRPGEDGLGLDSGVPQSVYVLQTEDMVQLRGSDGEPLRLLLSPGATVDLPGGAGSVTFDGVKRYAALDIRYDPSKVWVLGFALLSLAGLTTSLFVRRRRLWARVSRDDEGRTVVEVAGLARGDDAGLGPLVAEVLQDVKTLSATGSTTPKE